jgi:RNA polymerase sigma-70 factor (ECF subfamily)
VDIDGGDYYESNGILSELETPESIMIRDQLEHSIFEAIEALPEELRVAITLREFDGLSYEDIAEIMQCPVGTVRSRIFRAREAIEKQIEAGN